MLHKRQKQMPPSLHWLYFALICCSVRQYDFITTFHISTKPVLTFSSETCWNKRGGIDYPKLLTSPTQQQQSVALCLSPTCSPKGASHWWAPPQQDTPIVKCIDYSPARLTNISPTTSFHPNTQLENSQILIQSIHRTTYQLYSILHWGLQHTISQKWINNNKTTTSNQLPQKVRPLCLPLRRAWYPSMFWNTTSICSMANGFWALHHLASRCDLIMHNNTTQRPRQQRQQQQQQAASCQRTASSCWCAMSWNNPSLTLHIPPPPPVTPAHHSCRGSLLLWWMAQVLFASTSHPRTTRGIRASRLIIISLAVFFCCALLSKMSSHSCTAMKRIKLWWSI